MGDLIDLPIFKENKVQYRLDKQILHDLKDFKEIAVEQFGYTCDLINDLCDEDRDLDHILVKLYQWRDGAGTCRRRVDKILSRDEKELYEDREEFRDIAAMIYRNINFLNEARDRYQKEVDIYLRNNIVDRDMMRKLLGFGED